MTCGREGVNPALTVDHERGTGVIQVLVEPDGERTMVPDRGANAVWASGDVPEALIADANLLHVVGYVLLDEESRRGALTAMAHARANGVPISLDPSSHAPLGALGADGLWSMVGQVTILLPNRREAQVLSGEADPADALRVLSQQTRVVAIKLDRDGCIAGEGNRVYRAPAPRAAIVNATGAGDAFDAAFLARWVVNGDVERGMPRWSRARHICGDAAIDALSSASHTDTRHERIARASCDNALATSARITTSIA